MSSTPADYRFTESHEWHKLDGKTVTIGISRFAVDELTDVTYVELPAVGDEVEKGESFGEIESVKATSDLYAGVSGKVVEVNNAAADDPALINDDPFGTGWLIKVEANDPGELDHLLDASAYDEKYPVG